MEDGAQILPMASEAYDWFSKNSYQTEDGAYRGLYDEVSEKWVGWWGKDYLRIVPLDYKRAISKMPYREKISQETAKKLVNGKREPAKWTKEMQDRWFETCVLYSEIDDVVFVQHHLSKIWLVCTKSSLNDMVPAACRAGIANDVVWQRLRFTRHPNEMTNKFGYNELNFAERRRQSAGESNDIFPSYLTKLSIEKKLGRITRGSLLYISLRSGGYFSLEDVYRKILGENSWADKRRGITILVCDILKSLGCVQKRTKTERFWHVGDTLAEGKENSYSPHPVEYGFLGVNPAGYSQKHLSLLESGRGLDDGQRVLMEMQARFSDLNF